MSNEGVNKARRRLLLATSAVGAAGAVGVAVPFVKSMLPSARAKAAGAPVEADISKLEAGALMTVEWRSKPVWILRRTKAMIESLDKVAQGVADPESKMSRQPAYVDARHRAVKAEYLIVEGVCTHLGCSPQQRLEAGDTGGMGADWQGGFYCPCHGSTFDLAGRVFKNKPAPINLPVPPHKYLSDTTIVIGVDPKKGAA